MEFPLATVFVASTTTTTTMNFKLLVDAKGRRVLYAKATIIRHTNTIIGNTLYWCLNARRDICRFYYESDPAHSFPSCSNDMNDPATFVITLQGLELIKASPTVQDSAS
ncbi:hypothetical protein Gohar_027574 [Gossypium harknessii]|uniref:Uncharacterized protein n=1 Tax=Gossypium harknessii TaxID=34285 RepID=A0A7J9HV80_9ROSI|nr:hypothetical protein [Gossypium harknessii]